MILRCVALHPTLRDGQDGDMHIEVNGTRLWFDVDGPGLVPDGPTMRSRPTIVLVHGGPGGYDHSYFKPQFSRLASVAQVVYLDLRGVGRSERSGIGDWSLERCADDVAAFCNAIGIIRPIVLGHSMGGFVALLHAIRHPDATGGLVVVGTVARWDIDRLENGFRVVAGDRVAKLARRDFESDETVTPEESGEVAAAYGANIPSADVLARRLGNPELGPIGWDRIVHYDVVAELAKVTCPTLVVVGERDPVTPVDGANEIIASLSPGLGHLFVVPGAGHFTWLDAPDGTFSAIETFVTRDVR
jgi:pimeloyl-ACP methyl ester carboxylesterase